MSALGSVTVTTLVAVDPATAFAVFTDDIDRWWKRDPRHRFTAGRRGTLRFEPGEGGRLVEAHGPAAADSFEIGRVVAWQPGSRLVFEFRTDEFAPGERTEVEVLFEPAGDDATRVTLVHRGWDSLRADHPARRGFEGGALASMIGLYWADLLVALGAHSRREDRR